MNDYLAGMTRTEAEAELVDACIEHEDALRSAMRLLPVDCFSGYRTRDVFYTLAGWLAKGTYNPETNRDRLDLAFPGDDFQLFLDDLFCPFPSSEEYAGALVRAVAKAQRLQVEADAAVRRQWQENPFGLEEQQADEHKPATGPIHLQ